MTRDVLLLLLLASQLAHAEAPDATAAGGSACDTSCVDVSAYYKSEMYIISDVALQKLDIALGYVNRTTEGIEEHKPVKNAVIIMNVRKSGADDEGTLTVLYTGSDGKAAYDFSGLPGIAENAYEFRALYCHSTDICEMKKCFEAMGFNTSRTDEIESQLVPPEPQDPAQVRFASAFYPYTPPPRTLGVTPAFCLPLALIFALLGGALYMSGRNPFAAFDFSTPRMGKHLKYMARARGLSFEAMSAVTGVLTAATMVTPGGRGLLGKQEKEKQKKKEEKTGAKGGWAAGLSATAIGAGMGEMARGAKGRTESAAKEAGGATRGSIVGGRMGERLAATPLGQFGTQLAKGQVGGALLTMVMSTPFGALIDACKNLGTGLSIHGSVKEAVDAVNNFRRTAVVVDSKDPTKGTKYEVRIVNGKEVITATDVKITGTNADGSPRFTEVGKAVPVNLGDPQAVKGMPKEVYNTLAGFQNDAKDQIRKSNETIVNLLPSDIQNAKANNLESIAKLSDTQLEGLVKGLSDQQRGALAEALGMKDFDVNALKVAIAKDNAEIIQQVLVSLAPQEARQLGVGAQYGQACQIRANENEVMHADAILRAPAAHLNEITADKADAKAAMAMANSVAITESCVRVLNDIKGQDEAASGLAQIMAKKDASVADMSTPALRFQAAVTAAESDRYQAVAQMVVNARMPEHNVNDIVIPAEARNQMGVSPEMSGRMVANILGIGSAQLAMAEYITEAKAKIAKGGMSAEETTALSEQITKMQKESNLNDKQIADIRATMAAATSTPAVRNELENTIRSEQTRDYYRSVDHVLSQPMPAGTGNAGENAVLAAAGSIMHDPSSASQAIAGLRAVALAQERNNGEGVLRAAEGLEKIMLAGSPEERNVEYARMLRTDAEVNLEDATRRYKLGFVPEERRDEYISERGQQTGGMSEEARADRERRADAYENARDARNEARSNLTEANREYAEANATGNTTEAQELKRKVGDLQLSADSAEDNYNQAFLNAVGDRNAADKFLKNNIPTTFRGECNRVYREYNGFVDQLGKSEPKPTDPLANGQSLLSKPEFSRLNETSANRAGGGFGTGAERTAPPEIYRDPRASLYSGAVGSGTRLDGATGKMVSY